MNTTTNEPRPYLKRTKSPRKSKQQEIPAKISKSNSMSESRDSLTPTKIDIETDPSLLEPELLVDVKPKDEPLEDPIESGEYSEHSLPEMDMSSMLDTNLGETLSQSSLGWTKSDMKSMMGAQRGAEVNMTSMLSHLFF